MVIEDIKQYVFGMPFKIIMDHSALKFLLDKKGLEGQIMSWAEFLMSYNFKIIYRPRKENVVVDYLSRALAVIDVGPILEIKEATRQNIIWIPMEERPGFL